MATIAGDDRSGTPPLARLRGFHPGWYGAVMGTAIVGIVAYQDPGQIAGLGDALRAVGVLMVAISAVLAVGLGVPYAAGLLGTYLRRGRLPYGLGWWAFTFPLGAYTASTLALARAWDAGALEALTAILFVGLCVFWVVVATRTLGAVRSGAMWRR